MEGTSGAAEFGVPRDGPARKGAKGLKSAPRSGYVAEQRDDGGGPGDDAAMPANLPPQYNKAEEEYRRLSAPADRLEKLREMFRLLPKHKGTEKLQAELKQKISRAKDDLEGAKAGGKKAGVSYRVPSEGAGQVVLVGAPNAGKSALLAALTKARPEVAAYPFTTRAPIPGMMDWEDVRLQLVDLPPASPDFFEPWLPSVVRSADAALLVVDLGDDDAAEATEAAIARFEEKSTVLVGALPHDVEDESIQHVKTLLVANKADAPGAADRLDVIRDLFGGRFPVIIVSATTGEGLDRAEVGRRMIFWRSYGFTRKCPASPLIRRTRSPSRSAARSSTWPGPSTATWRRRSRAPGSGARGSSRARR